jgi:hypothetical protein
MAKMMAVSEIKGVSMGYRSIPVSELGENMLRAEIRSAEYGRRKLSWAKLITISLFDMPYILFCFA